MSLVVYLGNQGVNEKTVVNSKGQRYGREGHRVWFTVGP